MKNFIPTPGSSVLELGFLTIHFYAICILLGIIAAIALTRYRYKAVGGNPEEITELAIYAVPAGIIGGRIYHVISSPENYFGPNGSFKNIIKIWEGGLGIWGAIALGTAVSFLFFRVRLRTLNFRGLADAIAPGLLIAQGIGRFGNWFNGELFGRPTSLPWGLEIPLQNRPLGFESFEIFHPTFLYEAIWCFMLALFILNLKTIKRLRGSGAVFLIYVAGYCLGRFAIEVIRIDSSNLVLGQRVNLWVAALTFVGAMIGIFRSTLESKGKSKGKAEG